MTRPRLLDLFCGAGGCAAGYVRAGFEVHGVDIKPQPRYLLSGASSFTQADALEYLAAHGREFDAIHASPPCQAYSAALRHMASPKPQLIEVVRRALAMRPYVIENVVGAPLHFPALVCGTALGLPLRRHRLFECSFLAMSSGCIHSIETMNPHRASSRLRIGYAPERRFAEAMGTHWMSKAEARQAIPPAYTQFIGKQLLSALHAQPP